MWLSIGVWRATVLSLTPTILKERVGLSLRPGASTVDAERLVQVQLLLHGAGDAPGYDTGMPKQHGTGAGSPPRRDGPIPRELCPNITRSCEAGTGSHNG